MIDPTSTRLTVQCRTRPPSKARWSTNSGALGPKYTPSPPPGRQPGSASANVDRAQASIREAEADVAHSQAALDRAKAESAYAENNLHRVEPLLVKQYVTVDQVDQARTTEQASAQSVHEAESQLALNRAHLNTMLAALAEAKASSEQSTAQLHQSQSSVLTLDPLVAQRQGRAAAIANAQYNYNQCRVYAPFDARVTSLVISEGAYAHIGQEIFTLIDTRVWWVVANFRETQLKHIQPGMTADVYVMSDSVTAVYGRRREHRLRCYSRSFAPGPNYVRPARRTTHSELGAPGQPLPRPHPDSVAAP